MTIFSPVNIYSEELLTVLNGKNDRKHSSKYLFKQLAKTASKPEHICDFVACSGLSSGKNKNEIKDSTLSLIIQLYKDKQFYCYFFNMDYI